MTQAPAATLLCTYVAAALTQYPALQEPVWLPGERQYYCNNDVEGVEIGASTVEIDSDHDTAATLGPGPWRHFVEVPLGAHRVPAVRLELRLATEMLSRRRDRAEPLIAFLSAHGSDTRLAARALANAGVAPRTRTAVLAKLAPSTHSTELGSTPRSPLDCRLADYNGAPSRTLLQLPFRDCNQPSSLGSSAYAEPPVGCRAEATRSRPPPALRRPEGRCRARRHGLPGRADVSCATSRRAGRAPPPARPRRRRASTARCRCPSRRRCRRGR